MLFILFKKLLNNFGFQMEKEEGPQAFFDKVGKEKSLCIIKQDSLDWYVPKEKSESYLNAYNANSCFQFPPEKRDSSVEGFEAFRFMLLLNEYDQLLHIVYFLQSGCVDAFFIDGKSYFYPDIIIQKHSVVNAPESTANINVAEFKAALAQNPNSAILHNYLGKLYIEAGELDPAAKCFVDACGKEEHYAEPYSNMGALMWNIESKEKGFKLFCEAFLRNPFDVTLQDNFIKSGVELGALEAMNDCLAKIQEYYPGYSGMLFVKALFLEKLGKKEESKEALQQYLEKNPHDERASKMLEEISMNPGFEVPSPKS